MRYILCELISSLVVVISISIGLRLLLCRWLILWILAVALILLALVPLAPFPTKR